MPNLPFSARDRVQLYASQRKLTITAELGSGYDGYVVGTDAGYVIKSMNNIELYRNELAVYRYMKHKDISILSGFRIPKLVGWDDNNLIIEMTFVQPPYVVDFAGARLTKPEPFSDEIMDYWTAQKREEFGDDWPQVSRLKFAFESRGIYLTDLHTRNIACR